jgi:pimeloyl-ACP methyl ester carboxylesterase
MEKTFYYQQFAIQYSDGGTGIPVFLIHGFGEDSQIFNHQAAFLREHCRLIIPDLPGTRQSQPIGPNFNDQILHGLPASIDALADTIAALAEHLSVEKYILLGHSMGGYITLALAEKHPEKLFAFGLIHSSAFADTEDKKTTRRKGIEFIGKQGGFAFLQTAIPGLFFRSFKEKHPGQIAALIEQFNPQKTGRTTLDATLTAYYEAMIARPDRTDVLRSSKVPVLFIIGTEDKAVPMDDMLQQSHLPQVAYVHIHANTAHMSMLEDADSLGNELLNFINQTTNG